ncbi:transposase, partial [Thomasclavelia cocleata]|uniref:transposase n=1 Tax=Thomasclavelia cocleata TaxID=69824 RepID=UPI00255AC767
AKICWVAMRVKAENRMVTKRMIFGTYYSVSKKHLQRYIDEYVFRFNTRNISDIERFNYFCLTFINYHG